MSSPLVPKWRCPLMSALGEHIILRQKFFTPKFFYAKIFLRQNFFTSNLFTSKLFYAKIFLRRNFLRQIYLRRNYFTQKNILRQNFFTPKLFYDKFIYAEIILRQKLFYAKNVKTICSRALVVPLVGHFLHVFESLPRGFFCKIMINNTIIMSMKSRNTSLKQNKITTKNQNLEIELGFRKNRKT